MWNVTWKSLWARKFRLVTTSIAVLLGVAFMAGTLVLTSTMNRNFSDLFADAFKGTDVVVRGDKAFEGAQGIPGPREKIDESLLGTVSAVPGVRMAQGGIDGFAQVVDKDNKPVGAGGAPTFGGVWSNDSSNPFKLSSGKAPTNDQEVVLDKATTDETKYVVGDSFTVLTTAGPQKVKLSGIATFGTADSAGGAAFVLFTLDAAQKYMGEPGKLSTITVAANSGVSQEQLAERIKAVVPQETDVITGKAITKETQNDIKSMLGFFNTILLVFAGIALFVGVFIIYNTFSILVAQRSKETALLRAIGASRKQISRSVLTEAFIVGLVAGGLGLLAGIGVAAGLKALFSALGVSLPTSGIVVPTSAVVSSFVVGILVSVISAWLPARRSGKIPPIAAMRDVSIDKTGSSKKRVVFGLLLLGAGVASIMIGLFADVDKAYIPVGLGALITFLGVATLGPSIASPASRIIGFLPSKFRGTPGKLATQNARRNPRRTSATASALMIGVGLIGFLVVISSSVKASFNEILDSTVNGDFVIDAWGQTFEQGVPPTFVDQLNDQPEIKAAVGFPTELAQFNGKTDLISAFDTTRLTQVMDPKLKEGSLERLDNNSIAVSKVVADREKWKIGDGIDVAFAGADTKKYTLQVIYDNEELLGNYNINRSAFNEIFPKHPDQVAVIKGADGVDLEKVRSVVENAAAPYPNAKVQDQTEYKESLSKQIDQVLGILTVLLALAVVVALIGIANALALSIFERTREIGLLRAVGMTRRQVRTTVRWEAVIVSLLGTLLGLVIAVFFGISLVTALHDQGITELAIPAGSLFMIVIVGAIVGVLASLWPARKAARLNVLKAISVE